MAPSQTGHSIIPLSLRPFYAAIKMHFFDQIEAFRAFLAATRSAGPVGLVPTMGALHAGHLSLIQAARTDCATVVASIFVNPTQFNNPEDLAKYPRTLERDLAMLADAGCDAVIAPSVNAMYPTPSRVNIRWNGLDDILEGQFRPGHFSGVSLVVAKLFNLVRPDIAYFGQKDFQQFKIISRLTDELMFDIQLRCVETVREPDGLAMSSRNLRLNPVQRQEAVVFFRTLQQARQEILQGRKSIPDIRKLIAGNFSAARGTSLEYLELADRENLTLIDRVEAQTPAILLIAGYVGEVRLIDNLFV